MKRMLLCMLAALLLGAAGCRHGNGTPPRAPGGLPDTEAALAAPAPPASTPAPPASAPAQTATPIPTAEPPRSEPLLCSELAETEVHTVTLVQRTPLDSGWAHTYCNLPVDFNGLRLELIAFSFDGADPALTLRISLPAHWSVEVRDWMRREGLRLCFALDGRQVDAFRQREIHPSADGTGYAVVYRQCILSANELASARVFTVRPYVECVDTVWGSNIVPSPAGRTRESFPLSEGRSFTGVYRGELTAEARGYMENIRFSRIFLDGCALSLHLTDRPAQTLAPIMETVTVMEPLWEENIASGAYEDGAQIPVKRRHHLTKKDFSEVQFVLEQFHLWEEEMKLAFCLRFPKSWTDVECQSMVRDVDFLFEVDGVRQESGLDESIPQFFGRRGILSGESLDQNEKALSHRNYQTQTCREQYYVNWYSNLSIDQWRTKSNLTILPRFLRVTEVEEGILSQTPLVAESWSMAEEVVLYDLAISIDITPDLFTDGF